MWSGSYLFPANSNHANPRPQGRTRIGVQRPPVECAPGSLEEGLELSPADQPVLGSVEYDEMSKFRDAYMAIVGGLLWLANMTRVDIAYSASQLARFIPTLARRILKPPSGCLSTCATQLTAPSSCSRTLTATLRATSIQTGQRSSLAPVACSSSTDVSSTGSPKCSDLSRCLVPRQSSLAPC